MDAWGWEQLQPWLETRLELPVGPLFSIVTGPTRAGTGPTPLSALSCAGLPPGQACGDALPRISPDTPTPSPRRRWPCSPGPAANITATISSTFGGSAG